MGRDPNRYGDVWYLVCTVAHKGHAANRKHRCKQKRNAANKKETLQTKKKRCKRKRNAANKKRNNNSNVTMLWDMPIHTDLRWPTRDTLQIENTAANKKDTLQTKQKRCKQKKRTLQTKKGTAANIKKGTLQIKKRNAANKKQ